MAYLRPDYAAVVVKIIKELGGKPFLTDCNTLYTGWRSCVEHAQKIGLGSMDYTLITV